MSEGNNRIRAHNELYRFRSDIPRSKRLTQRRNFFSEYFTEMLLSYMYGPCMVKYGILSNSRRIKLQAVIDCLFLYLRLRRSSFPILQIAHLQRHRRMRNEKRKRRLRVRLCKHRWVIPLFLSSGLQCW